jgi:hypothetical protein
MESRMSMLSSTSKLHIFTTSTSDYGNIDNLLFSAELAGVDVSVRSFYFVSLQLYGNDFNSVLCRCW